MRPPASSTPATLTRTSGHCVLPGPGTAGPYAFVVHARRARHERFNELVDPEPVLTSTSYSSVIESDVPSSYSTPASTRTVIVTLVAAHRLVAWRRIRSTRFRRLLDRPSVILIDHGRLMTKALRRAHLTDTEVYAVLRQHGVAELDAVELLVLEGNGRFSVIRRNEPTLDRRLDPSAVEHG